MTTRTTSAPSRWIIGLTAVITVLPLMGCSAAAESNCEGLYEGLAESVKGVESADFDCTKGPSGESTLGKVYVADDVTEDQATAILEEVYKAYARQPEIDSAQRPSFGIVSENGSLAVGADKLGFDGGPNMNEVREKYGINPGDS
ncbi:hypothetical protein [Myceligenerans crystallogenes]|uniref:Lipoprotein n=1 Tax=Myceligenerans crystallogenes TaxID=316335 RepID=A0ABP4ZLP2_9MICO